MFEAYGVVSFQVIVALTDIEVDLAAAVAAPLKGGRSRNGKSQKEGSKEASSLHFVMTGSGNKCYLNRSLTDSEEGETGKRRGKKWVTFENVDSDLYIKLNLPKVAICWNRMYLTISESNESSVIDYTVY